MISNLISEPDVREGKRLFLIKGRPIDRHLIIIFKNFENEPYFKEENQSPLIRYHEWDDNNGESYEHQPRRKRPNRANHNYDELRHKKKRRYQYHDGFNMHRFHYIIEDQILDESTELLIDSEVYGSTEKHKFEREAQVFEPSTTSSMDIYLKNIEEQSSSGNLDDKPLASQENSGESIKNRSSSENQDESADVEELSEGADKVIITSSTTGELSSQNNRESSREITQDEDNVTRAMEINNLPYTETSQELKALATIQKKSDIPVHSTLSMNSIVSNQDKKVPGLDEKLTSIAQPSEFPIKSTVEQSKYD